MTDITLEQRAATVPPTTAVTFVPAFSEASRMLGMSAANGNHDGVVYWQGIVEQFEAAAKEALRLSAGADASPWRSIHELDPSDDLFWFTRGNTVDGPREPRHDDADYWDFFAPVKWPALPAAPRHETGEG